jgi:hypothetical protein
MMSLPLKWLFDQERDWIAAIRPEANYGNVGTPVPVFSWSDGNYRFLPGLYLLRWLNILLGAASLGFIYAAAKGFAGEGQIPLAALALAALTPQFLHTSSSVANDMLGVLAGSLLFWLASRAVLQRASVWEMAAVIVLAFLLPYLTKLTVLPVGIAAVAAVLWGFRDRFPDRWGRFAVAGLAVGAGLLSVGLWTFPRMGELFLRQIRFRALLFDQERLTLEALTEMVTQVVRSYWGLVGWLAVGLPGWLVWLLTSLALAGIGMALISTIRAARGRTGVTGERRVSWAVWLVAVLTVAAVLKNGLNTPHTQGRFLFPAIGALALLIVAGWDRLLPARFRPYLLPVVIVTMVLANLILWIGGVIPVYYQPFLD